MTKRTVIAVLIFAGLLAAAVLSLRQKPERNITRISFAAVEKDKIDRLEVAGKNPVELTKKDAKWILADGRDAEDFAVNGALDAILKVDSSDVVTTNTDKFAELEVDDAKGTKVRAAAGPKTVAEFVIGKSGAAGTYVRKGDTVYSVKGVGAYSFSKPAAQWHHLKLFADKLEDVTRVEVALAGETPYALVKKDDKWQLEDPKVVPDGFRFDAAAASTLATSLVNLTARDVADKDPGVETTKLNDKADVLAFVVKDGGRRELHLGGAAAENGVWAQVIGKADVYSVVDPLAKGLRKKALDLREMTVMKLEQDKVQKLEIADGKSRLVLEKTGTEWKIASSTETVPADFPFDSTLVERRLASLASVRAYKLAAPGAAAGLDKTVTKIVASSPGGTAVLAFGATTKEENNQEGYLARGNIDADTYVVAKWTHDQLMGGLPTFKKQPQQPMPQFDASGLQNLPPEVRANLMRQIAAQQGRGGPGMTAKLPSPPPPPPPSAGK